MSNRFTSYSDINIDFSDGSDTSSYSGRSSGSGGSRRKRRGKCKRCLSTQCTKVTLIVCAILNLLLCIGIIIVTVVVFPKLLDTKIQAEKDARTSKEPAEGSESSGKAPEKPTDLVYKMYVFSIENVAGVKRKEHVNLKQKGPYVYNLTEEVKNNRIYKSYRFDKEASDPLTEKDQIFPINVLILEFLYQVEKTLQPLSSEEYTDRATIINDALSRAFHENANIVFNATVKDLFFDGIVFCQDRSHHFTAKICRTLQKQAEKSSFFTIDRSTGAISFSLFKRIEVTKIKSKKAKPKKVWKENEYKCNDAHGSTDGTFPLHVDKAKTYEFNLDMMCMNIKLTYSKTKHIQTLPGYKFIASDSNFDTSLPENACFCVKNNLTKKFGDKDGCLPKGAIDLTPCWGTILLLSNPHFLHADESYFEKLEGLDPDPEDHQPFITVEPISGIPFEVHMKMQLSTVLRSVKHLRLIEKVDNIIVPMLWIDVGFTLPDSVVLVLRNQVYRNLEIVYYVKIIGCIITALAFLICIMLLICSFKTRRLSRNR